MSAIMATHFMLEQGDRWRTTAPTAGTDATVPYRSNHDGNPTGAEVDRPGTTPDGDSARSLR